MAWDRRTVLKSALTWGMAQAGLAWGEGSALGLRSLPWLRHRQALAASTQRKLALLVGINHYAENHELRGCLTDVELQREVLIHRFGFNPSDIVSLTGAAATREAIALAFWEHLVEQSQAGDVVLFHFSGYGNLMRLPSQGDNDPLKQGLVPSDGLFSTVDSTLDQPLINCLLEETLYLLVRSLPTDKVSLVLDTSYSPTAQSLAQSPAQPLTGNLRSRSLAQAPTLPNLEELTFQSILRRRLKAQGAAQDALPKGVILRAARSGQAATEISFNGAFSGLFTYALTQSLWATTPARRLYFTLTRAAEQITPIRGNQQQIEIIAGNKAPLLIYGLLPATVPGFDGEITQILDEKTVEFKWVGLPRSLVLAAGLNSILTTIGASNGEGEQVQVQVRSQKGLNAIAQILQPTPEKLATLAPGQGLQEVIRVLPRNQGLILALDTRLERIERVDATSALSSIKAIASIVVPGEGFADCVLSTRLAAVSDAIPSSVAPTLTKIGEQRAPVLDKKRYGLLSEGGVPLIHTMGKEGEAIKSAVVRLEPQWNQLLAAKIWNLTQNENSTRLKVRATLEVGDPTAQPLISKASQRQSVIRPDFAHDNPALALANNEPILPQLPPSSPLRLRLENNDTVPLYFLLLGLDSDHQAIVYFPGQIESGQTESGQNATGQNATGQNENKKPLALIASGETVFIPSNQAVEPWQSSKRSGLEQWLVIFTRQPCESISSALAQADENKTKFPKAPFEILANSQPIAQALLADLHRLSQVDLETYGIAPDHYALNLQDWASLSFFYQIGKQISKSVPDVQAIPQIPPRGSRQ
jgi:hypothetical protein